MTRPRSTRVILSINFNHDGSAVLLVDGRPRGFVCTERFSRLKKHPGVREDDVDELLAQAGIGIADVDHVLLCNLHLMDSPDVAKLHGSDLKHTWADFWVNQRNDRVRLRGREIPCTVNPEHHLIHAAAAYYSSPFDSGVSLAIDPTGCIAFVGRGARLYPLRRFEWFTANVGYTHVADAMFGSAIVGAGKVMGLAPYGRPTEPVDVEGLQVRTFDELMHLAQVSPVVVESDGRQLNATLAHFIQAGLEHQLARLFAELAEICERNGIGPNICLSGGTALNAIANQHAFQSSGFRRMHFHPACGDDGTAIGAAMYHWHHVLGNPREHYRESDLMYSVRSYSRQDVERAVAARADRLDVVPVADHIGAAARLVAEGAVVGWFDGASEVGPRALGHRSIVADPRDPQMRDRLNSRVKFREHFRPFAPSVLNERSTEWFGLSDSPYMLRACPVLRPEVPAITHVDGTSRIQTVTHRESPAWYDLISAFDRLTGVPLVLNTSLNIKGQPIVETPSDAVEALLGSGIDTLVFPGLLVAERVAADRPGAARSLGRQQ